MRFLYYYDLIDFDSVGNVKGTKNCDDKNKVVANFLYMICKYNQNLLHEKSLKKGEKLELPAFFKTDLNNLLNDVENGTVSKEYAIVKISKNCLPEVKKICDEAKNDREILEKLNDLVDVNSLEFAEKFKKVTNKKQLEYIMTHISAKLMDEINDLLCEIDDSKIKSKVYKKIIYYNGLVNAATELHTVFPA